MTTEIATRENTAALLERVVVGGDLSRLTPGERLAYYRQVCESVGLNPFTRPFEYITLQGKMTLYAKRDATDQLRKIHGVSVRIVSRERVEDVYVVTAQATDKAGRTDEAIGAVSLTNLRGEALANAIMKAETKAKRRVTLSICGLGLLDETETETIPGAVVTTGEGPARVAATPASGAPTPPAAEASHGDGTPDRNALLARVTLLADSIGLSTEERLTFWRTYCGNASRRNVDPAALADLIGALEARAGIAPGAPVAPADTPEPAEAEA